MNSGTSNIFKNVWGIATKEYKVWSNSQDLNLMENLWDVQEKNISIHGDPILLLAVFKGSAAIVLVPLDTFIGLVESMGQSYFHDTIVAYTVLDRWF